LYSSRPYFKEKERERSIAHYKPFGSFIQFWSSPEKNIKKRNSKKKKIETRDNREGALCVFSFHLCGGAL
jgi:hypothetical protein